MAYRHSLKARSLFTDFFWFARRFQGSCLGPPLLPAYAGRAACLCRLPFALVLPHFFSLPVLFYLDRPFSGRKNYTNTFHALCQLFVLLFLIFLPKIFALTQKQNYSTHPHLLNTTH